MGWFVLEITHLLAIVESDGNQKTPSQKAMSEPSIQSMVYPEDGVFLSVDLLY